MSIDYKQIEEEYNAGTLEDKYRKEWEKIRDTVPLHKPKHLDEDTFYSVLENKVNKNEATPRELNTVKQAALNGIYVPKAVTFEGEKGTPHEGRKAIPGYARSESDSLLGDIADFAGGFARGAGKGFTNTGEEAHKIFNSATGQDNAPVQAQQNSRKEADAALFAGHPVSSTIGDITGSIASTAPVGGAAGLGLKAMGLTRTGAAVASPLSQFAMQGALAPTEGGTYDRAANVGINTALGGAAQYGLPYLAQGAKALGNKLWNGAKAIAGKETPITETGAETLANAQAADKIGVPVTAGDAMRVGGSPRESALLAQDAIGVGQKDVYIQQQERILDNAKRLGEDLKQSNAATKFDGTDELVNLAASTNPHAEGAAKAGEAIADAMKNGTGRQQASAQMQGNLVLRQANASQQFNQVSKSAVNYFTKPAAYEKAIDEASEKLEKNELIPDAIRHEIDKLKSTIHPDYRDPLTGVVAPSTHNLAGMIDSLQSLRGRIHGIDAEGVISDKETAILRNIESALHSDIKSGLSKADPALLQKYEQANQYYAKEVSPFHDKTLSDAIRTFGSNKLENAQGKALDDTQKFALMSPLLGTKGRAAFADSIFNEMLDDVTNKAGSRQTFSMNDLKDRLAKQGHIFRNVMDDPEHADLLEGITRTLNLVGPANRVATTPGKRTALLGAPTVVSGIIGGGLGAKEGGVEGGAAGAAGAASLPLLGYTRALKIITNNPSLRNMMIKIGNLPPSSPASQAYLSKVSRAIGTVMDASANEVKARMQSKGNQQ